MDPLPIWWDATADQAMGGESYDLHALTQRPMAMYHSWGTQNAWLRQIHGRNPMYLPTKVWETHRFGEDDWARGDLAAWGDHRAGRPHAGAQR